MADIELVIKIDENLYRKIQSGNYGVSISNTCAYAVENATPLPKGHGDLIDRKELLKQPMDTANYPSGYVKIAPTIIEADKGEEVGGATP